MLLCVALGISTSYAQSFQITKRGSTTPVTSLTENMTQADTYSIRFEIKNISNSTKNYKIKKNIISTPLTCAVPQDIWFADLNLCYPYFVSLSKDPITIAPGEIHSPVPGNPGIEAHLGIGNCCGVYVVRYDVFDVNNATDMASVTITYNVSGDACSAVSIKEQSISATMDAMTPNPAAESTSMNYNIQSDFNKASIKLFAITGSLLKEIPLKENKGKVVLDVTEIPAGVYFYSLLVNEKVIHTNKLLVSH